jgi:serine/threonine protein phosphatase PrpC
MWRVVGASIQGVSHVKAGQPCQDAHAWATLADGALIAAVADGAGSAASAEIGARLAAQTAIEFLRGQLNDGLPLDEAAWQALLPATLQNARQQLEREAEARECALRELATTLLICVATERLTVAAQVGDGAMALENEARELLLLTAPQAGEYVNETAFLVSANYLEAMQFICLPERAQRLALFSDGLQRLALQMPLGKPHAPFFTPLFNFAAQAGAEANEQLAAFLRSPRIAERADDDLTLLLAARASIL